LRQADAVGMLSLWQAHCAYLWIQGVWP